MAYPVGIVGYRGYSGAELVRILERHPGGRPVLLEHREDAPPCTSAHTHLPCSPDGGAGRGHRGRVSGHAGRGLHGTGAGHARSRRQGRRPERRVPAAHRRELPHWYKEQHTQPALLAEAVYGLPEFCRDRIARRAAGRQPRLLSDRRQPGHRAAGRSAASSTARAGIVCDAKSGVSGAGRKPSLKTSFCEVTENFSAYSDAEPPARAGSAHEQRPGGARIQLHGAPAAARPRHPGNHLLPRRRARRAPPTLAAIYESATRASRSCASTTRATCRTCTPWQRTNFCDIGVKFDAATGRGVVVSAIDNLVKGAAGPGRAEHEPDAGLRRNGGPAVKVLVKLGGTLLDAPELARGRWRAQIAAAARAGHRARGGARRRQADDALPRRARRREPLRERAARHHAGDAGRGAEGVRRQRQPRAGGAA